MNLAYGVRLSVCAVPLLACASAPTQRAYVAPTEQTVFTSIEEMTTAPGQIIYVQNQSSVPVTVYSVTLRDCDNIKPRCESPQPLRRKLAPNARATLLRIEPSNPQRSFTFHYTFGWRADSAAKAALGALASGGDSAAQARLGQIRHAEERRRSAVGAQDLDLTAAEMTALASRAVALRAAPDSLLIRIGQRFTLDTIHVLLVGAQGETLGRVRALQWRVPSGVLSLLKPDTLVGAAAGRTAIQLRVPDDLAPAQASLHSVLLVPIVVRP